MALVPRIVTVTGGGSEIGREICQAFVEHGASLIVGDPNPVAADAVATRLQASGANAVGLGVDTTDPTSSERMVEEALDRVGQILHEHPSPAVREAAVYGLMGTFDTRVVEPLLAAFENRSEEPKVRGQAAEGIGCVLQNTDARRRQFKRATRILISGLRDESAEIRFWCAYALGVMRAKTALEELRRVAATDTAMYPRWWRVADEAADAIMIIEGRSPPERTPMGSSPAAEP